MSVASVRCRLVDQAGEGLPAEGLPNLRGAVFRGRRARERVRADDRSGNKAARFLDGIFFEDDTFRIQFPN